MSIKSLFSKQAPRAYQDPVVNPTGSEFEVNKWIISEFVTRELVPVAGVHPFPLDELMLMTAAVCRFRPGLIFEWGTNIGKSARIFYEITRGFKLDAVIHSIDLPEDVHHNEHPRQDRGRLVRGIPQVKLHQGDGLATSLEILKAASPKDNVVFFVDGDHGYDSVKRELTAILNECPGAAVLLHDTFYQSSESKYNTGPFRAIEDVLGARNEKYRKVTAGTGLPGMTLVYKE